MNAVTTFAVEGIHCAACIAKLERGLSGRDGIAEARVNFTTKRLRIEHDEVLGVETLREAIGRVGFDAHPFLGETDTGASRETRELVKCLAVAGFAAMNVMLLSVSVWSGADGATRQLFHWLSALIAIPAVAYAGRPFFRSAWGALRHGRANMDVPISIGVIVACGVSVYETSIWGRHAYFDGAVTLLFFLLAGRALDSVMRARAQDGAAALLRQTAPGALVLGADGTSQWRSAEELAPGMRMLVAAGERLAADGRVETGASTIDRALVTGESRPEDVGPGSGVLAGTINLDAPIVVKVTAAGEATAIADIARLMSAAGGAKSRYVRLADRAARIYAPAVHTLAALSLIGWMLAGAGLHQAVTIAVAVLIITCPCALGLAVPVSQVVASGALMRVGVLIKDGAALERLAEADVALFDKTGTLTLGQPVLDGELPLAADERPVALALARASRHPLSQALAAALGRQGVVAADLAQLTERAGEGIKGEWQGLEVQLARPAIMGLDPGEGGLATAFRIEGRPARLIRFRDALRPDATEAIERLRALNLEPAIVSGDRQSAVAEIGHDLSMSSSAELSPRDKFEAIEALEAQGRRVLMVGDGLNDGPALKSAHVSIAPSSASDIGQTAADLLFLGDRLMPIPIAVAAARRTMRVVRQNLALAIGYNVVAVPLALAGQVTPLVAALAMSGSSILVVGNAMRLRTAAR